MTRSRTDAFSISALDVLLVFNSALSLLYYWFTA
jgi:hypothetical protein